MTAIPEPTSVDVVARMSWRRRVRDCIAIKVKGPCCPLCRAVPDDPEHGRDARSAASGRPVEALRRNPQDWPDDWPDIPVTWQPHISESDRSVVFVRAAFEVTPSAPHVVFTVYPLAIRKAPGTNDGWDWFDGACWEPVFGPPLTDTSSAGGYDWYWSDASGADGIREFRSRRINWLAETPLEYADADEGV